MTLPVHHRPGPLLERPFQALSWGEPTAAEFDDLFERMARFLQSASITPAVGAWSPLADLHETDVAYVVEAELPGIKREDIDIGISDRGLCITGEYKQCEREGVLRRSTRRTGRFEYWALLPADVRAEEITAELADGVLTITAPKGQAARPHHIEITQA
ncbi:Hsp20/alpha crystallin family protein [Streptomyces sp. NPDC057545]|uniref:Hsp20/alpha crystallin family protein n=1 Tax=Streptomyces sp. NPDC057545 TaxID=3346164 RepID=UPI0036CEF172